MPTEATDPQGATFLVGGYTADAEGSARGIGLARTLPDGRLQYLGAAAEVASPSWVHVADGVVLAVAETTGDLVSLRAHADGRLVEAGRVPTGGTDPCHIAVTGDIAVVSAYGSGTVSWHPLVDGVAQAPTRIATQTGSGPHPDQRSARAHAALPLPDGRVLVADLGADAVVVYAAGGAEWLGAVALPAGTGPRDLRLLDDGRVLLLGELDGTLTALDPGGDATGVPTVLASVALPGMRPGTHAAAIAVHDGVAYVGLRRANRIAAVAIADGRLDPIGDVDCGGDWPRFTVAVDGVLHVANERSSTIASFRPVPGGLPELIGEPTAAPSPSHLVPLIGRGLERLHPLVG